MADSPILFLADCARHERIACADYTKTSGK